MLPGKRLLLYFLFIFLISFAGNFLILRNAGLLQRQLLFWYGLHIVWIGSIITAGYFCWRKYPKKWLLWLWLGMYIFAGLLFFSLGVIDVFIHRFPNMLRKDISKIRVFFFGPVPFALLYFISRIVDMPFSNTTPQQTEQ